MHSHGQCSKTGSGLKKNITLGIGIEKKIMSRDRAGPGLKTHPVLEHWSWAPERRIVPLHFQSEENC